MDNLKLLRTRHVSSGADLSNDSEDCMAIAILALNPVSKLAQPQSFRETEETEATEAVRRALAGLPFNHSFIISKNRIHDAISFSIRPLKYLTTLSEFGLTTTSPGVEEARQDYTHRFEAIAEMNNDFNRRMEEMDAFYEAKEQWEEDQARYVQDKFAEFLEVCMNYEDQPASVHEEAKKAAEQAFAFLNPPPVSPHPGFEADAYHFPEEALELEVELLRGNAAAKLLVEHLCRMGADRAEATVTSEDRKFRYTVEEIRDDKRESSPPASSAEATPEVSDK